MANANTNANNPAANQQQAAPQQAAPQQQQAAPQQAVPQQQQAQQAPAPEVTLLGYDVNGNALYGKPANPAIYYKDTLRRVGYVLAGAALGAVGYKVYQNRQIAKQQRQLLLTAPSTPQENMTYDR